MSAPDADGISAIVPAFEEAAQLGATLDALVRTLEELTPRWEVVLVTSTAARDGTVELARTLAGRTPRVRVVEQLAADAGYGRAVALGVSHAELSWILLTDADGQFDFGDLSRFVARSAQADAVLGYRARRADSLARRLAAALYTRVVRSALGVRVRDVDCAFKLVRREVVGRAPLSSRTGAVNAELLGRLIAADAVVVEEPVTHRPRQSGASRFERRLGVLGSVPDPVESFAIAREVGALALRRLVARFSPE